MTRGLALPLGVNVGGGARLVERDEQASKIITMALSDNDNRNAFQQDLGLGADMVFAIESPALRAQILRRLTNVFREFEQQELFKLVTDTVEFSSGSVGSGDLNLTFKYINLESDEVSIFSKNLSELG